MRRALVVGLVALATLAPLRIASAAEEQPNGTFTSPTRAVAGAPIWVRSITPCPVVDGAYQFVRVGISPQSRPNDLAYVESTDGDLRRDGSWEVTISAPSEMANGVTKSYDVQVQCLLNEAPYAAPDRGEVTATTLDPEVSIFRYFLRPLYVTGYGGADADPAGTAEDDATDSSTTSSSTTTSTTTPIATTSTSPLSLNAAGLVTTTRADDEKQRAAEARAELEAQRSEGGGGIVLDGSPLSATSPGPSGDSGLPWWSFVAATMLAVGALVAFGARRAGASAFASESSREARRDRGVLLGEREVGGD